MRAAIAFLLLSSLSSSLSENQISSLKESQARVLLVQPVQSEEQCRQACGDQARAGHLFCSLSTEEPRHCIVLDCPQMPVCHRAKRQDIQELVTEYTSPPEKWNNFTTTETLLTHTTPGTSLAPPITRASVRPTEVLPRTPPVAVTRGNHTELGNETRHSTDRGISAAPDDTSSLGPVLSATTGGSSALTVPQVQVANEETSTVTTMRTTLALTTEAGTATLPATHDPMIINGPGDSRNTTATSGSASSPAIQALPTPPVPSTPEIPVTTPSPVLFSSTNSTEAFMSTPTMSTSTRAEAPTTPEPAPSTPQAADPTSTPAAVLTTAAQAAETSGTSQTTERALFQTSPSPVAPKVTTENSPTMPETSTQTGTESQYERIATSPLTQYLVNKNLLLAMLLAGTIFFIAILVLLAMQAYESYKKKDYTQVDYLINGMYADSEM
ncbi:LOW QUALITY PROTEIN: uncharacterized protein C11orf24 homolog [Dromiciops gliroides]|uniref:LOW QUALITY PROTEIN: uncharacterized protein C11orf24 homolog n=1 Tax=Dromiciops gliroides TaxID=33562 RepID=UPI001CC415E7|nr:LOW QUALITY PROTEIN: uncharacterized protein C11orf24 homolog [Dromiciops gliroides]